MKISAVLLALVAAALAVPAPAPAPGTLTAGEVLEKRQGCGSCTGGQIGAWILEREENERGWRWNAWITRQWDDWKLLCGGN
ncbi:hypothetical protein BJX99DRAFT_258443 [Aspergillus californicus]